MSSDAHAKTLFHLIPRNQIALDSLTHPDNKRFVSPSLSAEGELGLEIGYHVSPIAQGHVIARLGRDADLILQESTPEHAISRIHVQFEIHPDTKLILLSARSKRVASVAFKPRGASREQKITGDGVLLYGVHYSVRIASYAFDLFWRDLTGDSTTNVAAIKDLALQCYETALEQMLEVKSRLRPTGYDNSELLSWHITRVTSTKLPVIQPIDGVRERVGSGAFGEVFKAVDKTTGHPFAIKVVDLQAQGDVDIARACLHREIKAMEKLSHVG
jgi:hypothetical protein